MYKIIKNDPSVSENGFKTHLFPSIAISTGPKFEWTTAEKNGFRPIDLGMNQDSPHDLPEGSPASETPPGEAEDPTPGPEEMQREVEELAYAKGFVEGEKAGIGSEKKQLQPLYDTLSETISGLEKLKKEISHNAEKELVKLALAIAEKILHREIATDKEAIFRVVEKALVKIDAHERIKIRINKSDLELMSTSGFQISGLYKNAKNATIEGDDSISRGGCVIETDFGSIDARIENQLRAVEGALISEL